MDSIERISKDALRNVEPPCRASMPDSSTPAAATPASCPPDLGNHRGRDGRPALTRSAPASTGPADRGTSADELT